MLIDALPFIVSDQVEEVSGLGTFVSVEDWLKNKFRTCRVYRLHLYTLPGGLFGRSLRSVRRWT